MSKVTLTNLGKSFAVLLITCFFSSFFFPSVPGIPSALAATLVNTIAHNHPSGNLRPGILSAPTATLTNKSSGEWSNPGIWDLGRLPTTGDKVEIASGTTVTYDLKSEADLQSVTVHGKLIFSQSKDTNLDTGHLLVMPGGYLEIGTETNPLSPNITAQIRLTEDAIRSSSDDPDSDMEAMTQGALMVMGQAELHGAPKRPTFIKLANPALVGQKSITLVEAPTGWQVGDEIVLGGGYNQSEAAIIASIKGMTIQLTTSLTEKHPVILYKARDGTSFEFRADVGNLSRNIKIMSKYPNTARGHTMVMDPGVWHLSYVEYRHLGGIAQPFPDKDLLQPLLGRYAIHFHKLGTLTKIRGERLTMADTMYVKGASIVDTQNHALRIHGTDRVLVEDNVSYSTLGHSFDVGEDGSEMENVVRHNLVVKARPAWNLEPRFFEFNKFAAGFWFGSMGQFVEDNVASDVSRGYGMYKIRPTPPNRLLGNVSVEPNEIPIKHFVNNEVYGSKVGVDFYHFVGIDAGEITDMKIWMCGKANRTKTGFSKRTGRDTALIWRNPLIANVRLCDLCKGRKGQRLEDGHIIEQLPAIDKDKGKTETSVTSSEEVTEAAVKP